ncbi:hypothetical protein HMPREF2738_01238, partial [Clostridiales bacterium KLE1615]
GPATKPLHRRAFINLPGSNQKSKTYELKKNKKKKEKHLIYLSG